MVQDTFDPKEEALEHVYKPFGFPANLLIHPQTISFVLKMKYATASLAFLTTLGECLSLPPLIPSIPGVTDALTTNAPPLPILQVPTPPLESPPFTPSDIKPKKIGYFWTGSADKFHKGRTSICGVLDMTLTFMDRFPCYL